MKDVKDLKENERIVTLNDKGVLLFGVIILSLTFMLGFVTSTKMKRDDTPTVFTREDLDKIVRLQEMEDNEGSDLDIYAYKDKNKNLIIEYKHGSKK